MPRKTARTSQPYFLQSFPRHRFPTPRQNQVDGLTDISESAAGPGPFPGFLGEFPTGSGKTAIGEAFLTGVVKQLKKENTPGACFYTTPTKQLAGQAHDMVAGGNPGLSVGLMRGRPDHQCLYYTDEYVSAYDSPCALLTWCDHRVDQETGATYTHGAEPCPVLWERFQSKQKDLVVTTTANYLYTALFGQHREKGWRPIRGLVVDEAHRLAKIARLCLAYEITDYHLRQVVELLGGIDPSAAEAIRIFRNRMIAIVNLKPVGQPTLLEDHEIATLIGLLRRVNVPQMESRIAAAVQSGHLDPTKDRAALKQLEVITRTVPRHLHSLEYSLGTDTRHPLNYTFAYAESNRSPGQRAQRRMVIQGYAVAPLIRKRLLAPWTLAYSGTIGQPDVFGYETGIEFPFRSYPSEFSADNARILLPTDTPNLAHGKHSADDLTDVFVRIALACKQRVASGLRALMLTISDAERVEFTNIAKAHGLRVSTYGEEGTGRSVAVKFVSGEGDILVGTAAQYGEGLDLPGLIAPLIVMLRPGYQNPTHPEAVFEMKRFGAGRYWALQNWRVTVESLQARRNIRSDTDRGSIVYVSRQYHDFLKGNLPEYLKPAYRDNLTLEQGMDEALNLVLPQTP